MADKITQNERLQRIKLVEELYEKGVIQLYEAPRRLTYFRLQCWVVAGLGLAFVSFYYTDKVWDVAKLKERGVELPWLVAIGEGAAVGVICIALGYALLRSLNHVQAIQLVKEMDTVFVRLRVRSAVPFLKTYLAIRPYNLLISEKLVWPKTVPNWMRRKELNESSASAVILSVIGNSLRALPRFFWHIWNEGRRFLFYDGLVEMSVIGEDAKDASKSPYLLDIDGAWALHGKGAGGSPGLALYQIGIKER